MLTLRVTLRVSKLLHPLKKKRRFVLGSLKPVILRIYYCTYLFFKVDIIIGKLS